jgi:hypothetical protein
MTRFTYTSNQIAFLESGFKQWRLPLLTLFFNAWFGLGKNEAEIRSTLKNHRITSGRPPGFAKGERLRAYTREQAGFIEEKYRQLPLSKVTAEFNARFGTRKTERQIKAFTGNHRIRSGRTGQFTKGQKSWNAGTKGVMKPNKGNFTTGHKPANLQPFGYERICPEDGYILIKVDEINPYTGFRGWFRHKQIVVFEQHYGPVPEGHIVRFKDGNKLNCDPANLFTLTRALHVRLNQMGYTDTPDEYKMTVLGMARIKDRVGRIKREKRGAPA